MARWLNDNQRYGALPILLHWLSALVVVGMFSLGWWMVQLDYYDPRYRTAPDIHKSVGILFFMLTVLRLGLRLARPRPSPMATTSVWERRAAHFAHVAFYFLLFAMMTSGYLISTADERAISVFGWFEVPATITSIEEQEDTAGDIHLALAWSLIILAGFHALAALKHHFINKDATLRRMLGRT